MQSRGGAEQFIHFCVVGLGNHARTKLVPALIANGQRIALVSSQPQPEFADATRFAQISDAIANLPPDTVFVLATPPLLHFEQAMSVLRAGRDVIVEKPSFVTAEETAGAFACADSRGLVLAEAYMHKHTQLFKRLMAWWKKHKSEVCDMDIAFLIPSMPPGTFRQSDPVACSSLYDIGCYALSFCADLGLPLQKLALHSVEAAGDPDLEMIVFGGVLDGIRVLVRVGHGDNYTNQIMFRTREGQTLTASPAFYGRPGPRSIVTGLGETLVREIVPDENAFEIMFRIDRGRWFSSQGTRRAQAIDVATVLERLAGELEMARNA